MIDPASVIGLGFAVDALVHLVPEDAMPEVPVRLQALTSKQFVRPTVAEADFYRFGHSVIKDSAYRSLLKRTRADLHERFVDWAEPINRERGRELEFEEILGYHLEQAYRYRVELGIGRRCERDRRAGRDQALLRGPARARSWRHPGGGQPAPPVDRAAAGDVGLPARAHGRPRRRQSPAR